jgi:hypothetical protein
MKRLKDLLKEEASPDKAKSALSEVLRVWNEQCLKNGEVDEEWIIPSDFVDAMEKLQKAFK